MYTQCAQVDIFSASQDYCNQSNNMYHLYILLSEKTGKYYIGSTGNLEDRLIRHNSGRSNATKSGIPWKLKYKEEFTTRSEAIKRELEVKSWKSHERITHLVNASR